MTTPHPPDSAGPPAAEALEALPADDWALVLTHLRPALHDLEDADVTPAIQRLRAAPASRLAGGRTRREASALLAGGGQVWRLLHRRLVSDPALPASLSWLIEGTPPPSGRRDPSTTAPSADRQAAVRAQDAARHRERAARLQRERDEARRRLEGAQARAAAAEEAAAARERELDSLRDELASARAELTAAGEAREAAVERERRRAASERADLEQRLRESRRALDEARAATRQRDATPPSAPPAGQRRGPDRRGGALPGRPSRLPPRVRRGTREAVDALLHRGRIVLVDGYNVTKTQRPDLSLEQQRRWLTGALRTLASRTGVQPTVVWDSTVAGAAGRDERIRSVSVRFTAAGTSADDELHFAVEAMDADTPVVVVTDDRGLRRRLDPYGVDLLGTAELRWVLDG